MLLFHWPLQHRTAFSSSVGWFLSANLTSENQVPPSISGAADFGGPRDSRPALLPSLEWLDCCPCLLTRQLSDRRAGGAQAALRVSLPAGTCCIALNTAALFCHRVSIPLSVLLLSLSHHCLLGWSSANCPSTPCHSHHPTPSPPLLPPPSEPPEGANLQKP